MLSTPSTRRTFLASAGRAGTAAWLSLRLPWLAALNGCARNGGPNAGLSPVETQALEAFAAQIIPPVRGEPGAVELGAVAFVDRALGQPSFVATLPVVRAGLADLDARGRALGEPHGFAQLTATEQAAILRQIEDTEFFKAARTVVLIGAFADPSHGGNRDGAGWTMLGVDHRPSYPAPFGYYDGQSGA
jgi:hypothetical protein